MRYYLTFTIFFLLSTVFAEDTADTSYSGPPRIIAEMGLPQMPDTLIFARSDSALMQYGWSVRLRLFPDSSVTPDIFSLSLKYVEEPGEGTFEAHYLRACEWGLERLGRERSFYRIGDMTLAESDSSLLMSAVINPAFLKDIDSVQVYGVTDLVRKEGYLLRDMTDYGPLGKKIRDPVGDMNDSRFDIRFVKAEIIGLP